MATKGGVRKKVPKKVPPLHPVRLSQVVREPRPPSPLMDFINSLDGELEYREALLEFQNEWCDHPKGKQVVVATNYRPSKDEYNHEIRCEDCGRTTWRRGRGSTSAN